MLTEQDIQNIKQIRDSNTARLKSREREYYDFSPIVLTRNMTSNFQYGWDSCLEEVLKILSEK